MKICAVIAEYNPFHNGHLFQLGEIRKRSGCDKILCLMSGNFTQRGEAAVRGKYVRARHAVLCGADAVLELPAAFAVSPAELFARGALHLLAAIPAVTTLAFGCESGEKESFLSAARSLSREDKAFRASLKEKMKGGVSYVRARTETALSLYPETDAALLSSPNNILGVEYCRAILAEGANIDPLPILRKGSPHADLTLAPAFSSASAIRASLLDPSKKTQKLLRRNLPACVFNDLLPYAPTAYKTAALLSLLRTDDEEIAKTPDCAEGLEHRLKLFARSNPDYDDVVRKATTKRYTSARIRRVLLQTFLGVRRKEVWDFLSSPLYFRTLALREEGAEDLLSELARGGFPPVVRKSDLYSLKKEALSCFGLDARANELYGVLSGVRTGDCDTLFL